MNNPLERVRWNPNITLGNLLSIGSTICAVVVFIWYSSARITTMEYSIASEVATSAAMRSKYIPVVEGIIKSDDVQNERLQNVADAIKDLRTSNLELVKVMGDLRVAIAILNSQSRKSNAVDEGITK